MHRPLTIVALAASGLFAFASTATAETITVCANGCDYTSINDAIDASSNGDVIQLAAETYFEGEQIDPDGKAITLRGVLNKAGEPASVLFGASDHRVLICQSGEASATSFENLVIRNGSADLGGGMYTEFSSPTLTNCTFTNNSAAGDGGGMFNIYSSSPTLTNCTFTNNSAVYGGGGMSNNNGSSSPTLTDCNFCGNTSGTGNRNINGSIDGSSSGNLLLLNCNTGDVNFDLQIDSGDLGYLLALWNASSVLNADINLDGEVNGADLAYILSYFGGTTDATTAP